MGIIAFLTRSMISQKARYALKALVALARADDSMIIGEIAEQQQIPRKFLEQILLDLKHHGIVASRRGRLGGYGLLTPPDQITFGRVLRIIDGPIAPLPCLSRIAYRRCPDCKIEAKCEIRRVFGRVAESLRDVLDRTTIAEAIGGRWPEAGTADQDEKASGRRPA
jgi:Rrf2 family protein